MADYEALETAELEKELKKQTALLEDIQHERAFLGKQAGMHIKVSEFDRLDRDADRAEGKISTLEKLLAAKSS